MRPYFNLGANSMKKIFLTITLAIGVLAVAAEIREHRQGVAAVAPSPDAPPPVCWPDCGPNS
jgi:hypothetical protein